MFSEGTFVDLLDQDPRRLYYENTFGVRGSGRGGMPSGELVQQGEERRVLIVKFIRQYVSKHRISPTVTEIAEGVGLNSTASTKAHLDRLQRDGVISMLPRTPRSISLTEDQ